MISLRTTFSSGLIFVLAWEEGKDVSILSLPMSPMEDIRHSGKSNICGEKDSMA